MQNNVLLKMDLVYCLKHNSKKLMYFHDSSELPFVRLPDLIVSEFRNQRITILFFAEDIKYLGEWKAGVFFSEMRKAALGEWDKLPDLERFKVCSQWCYILLNDHRSWRFLYALVFLAGMCCSKITRWKEETVQFIIIKISFAAVKLLV